MLISSSILVLSFKTWVSLSKIYFPYSGYLGMEPFIRWDLLHWGSLSTRLCFVRSFRATPAAMLPRLSSIAHQAAFPSGHEYGKSQQSWAIFMHKARKSTSTAFCHTVSQAWHLRETGNQCPAVHIIDRIRTLRHLCLWLTEEWSETCQSSQSTLKNWQISRLLYDL